MLTSIGICSQCGASGEVGSKCEYCGSTIVTASHNNTQDEGHSMMESWGDFRLDGFSLVHDNLKGETDSPDYYVIEGNRTGNQGLIDRYGNFTIPCIYDRINAYLDYGICCVSKNCQHGVIDFDGNTVIPLCGNISEDLFVVQYGMIVGFNSVYDIRGNLKIQLPSGSRILLLSSNIATTYPKCKGLYDLNTGELLLSLEYKIERNIGNDLYLVNKFNGGVTRYGIYKPETKEFLFPTEYLSIQYQENRLYVARLQSVQNDATTGMRTITFSVRGNEIKIEKEEEQTFQTGSGAGCMLTLLIVLTLPISLFFLL